MVQVLDAGDLEHAAYLETMAAVVICQLFGGADPTTTFQLAVADVIDDGEKHDRAARDAEEQSMRSRLR